MTADLEWTCVDPSELLLLASEWDALVERGGYPAFMQAGFILRAIEAFGCKGGRLILGRRQGLLEATGIFVPLGFGRWTTYQPSQVPLGCWVMSRDLSWHHIVPAVLRALPGIPLLIGFTQQDPLLVPSQVGDKRLEVLEYVKTGWIDVAGPFEEFWQARGKNLRQNLRKQRRRLADDGNRVVFEFLEDPSDVDMAFLQFAELESLGWKSAGRTAIAIGDQQGAFYRAVLGEHSAKRKPFVMRLLLNGKPVAVDFGLHDSEVVIILKTTYDESLKALSPAQLLHQDAFEYLFGKSGVRRIEFYGKFMEWHSRWTEKSRMLFHVNYYRFMAVRRILGVLRKLKRRAASWGASSQVSNSQVQLRLK